MKNNFIRIYFKILLLIITGIFIVSGFSSKSSNSIKPELAERQKLFLTNNPVTLNFQNNTNANLISDLFILNRTDGQHSDFASSYSSISLNKNTLQNILSTKPDNFDIEIQTKTRIFSISLKRHIITSKDFNVKLIKNEQITNYNDDSEELFYYGTVNNEPGSFVTLSLFEDNLMGIITVKEGNYVIGAIKDDNGLLTDDYIIYNDNDLVNKMNFDCGIEGRESILQKNASANNKLLNKNISDNMTSDSVEVYFVADYQLFLDNGSNVQQTINFVKGFFNHVSVLYLRENIPVKVSRVDVYQAPDPYRGFNDSYQILLKFGEITKDNFPGDLGHLLSSYHNQQLGGIAWINVLCQSFNPADNSGRFAFSNIQSAYNPYPLYSWTVFVVTHEMGHNFASKHTHACVWPVFFFDNGSIDTCVITEENQECYDTNATATANFNGTLMSYCHLNGGVNFILGFGPLPGDTVRLGYAYAACIDSALNSHEIPIVFNLSQNFPNPYNPSTTIKFAMPEEGYVSIKIYDMLGKQVAELIRDKYHNKGIYSVEFNSDNYALASGVYFYNMTVINNEKKLTYSQIKKMVLLK